jgi:acetolactate synthase-1/3 small subunit
MRGKARRSLPRHFILILVENRPGVLARVSDLFCARGFNIDTLSVAETLDPDFSRVTCTTRGEEETVEQIVKHLRRLIEVRRVLHVPLDDPAYVSRELLLVKLRSPRRVRGEVLRLAEIFRARVVDISDGTVTLEATGVPQKLDALLAVLRPHGILEAVRTGPVALARGGRKRLDKGGGGSG